MTGECMPARAQRDKVKCYHWGLGTQILLALGMGVKAESACRGLELGC